MVVHATWIPDLRLSEGTWDRKTSLTLCKYAVKKNVSTSKTEEKTGKEFGTLPKCRMHSRQMRSSRRYWEQTRGGCRDAQRHDTIPCSRLFLVVKMVASPATGSGPAQDQRGLLAKNE